MVEVNVQARQGDSGGPIFNEQGELAGVLFGAGRGTTSGSYAGRVERFLAGAWPTGWPPSRGLPAQPLVPEQPQQGPLVAAAPREVSPNVAARSLDTGTLETGLHETSKNPRGGAATGNPYGQRVDQRETIPEQHAASYDRAWQPKQVQPARLVPPPTPAAAPAGHVAAIPSTNLAEAADVRTQMPAAHPSQHPGVAEPQWESLEWRDVPGAAFLLSQLKNVLAVVGAATLMLHALKAVGHR
jgi:hypothetical protein